MKRTIGTCSFCGGPVTEYYMMHIVGPFPRPQCEKCKAFSTRAYGPIIPMERNQAR